MYWSSSLKVKTSLDYYKFELYKNFRMHCFVKYFTIWNFQNTAWLPFESNEIFKVTPQTTLSGY